MASTKQKVNAHPLQRKYRPQEFSAETTQSAIQKPTRRQQEVARITQVPPKPQNWAYSVSRNIYDHFFFSFRCWKFRCTKYAQVVQVNRPTVGYSGLCCCVLHVSVLSIIPFVVSIQVLQTSFHFRLLKGQRWQDNVYIVFFIGFLHTFLLNS